MSTCRPRCANLRGLDIRTTRRRRLSRAAPGPACCPSPPAGGSPMRGLLVALAPRIRHVRVPSAMPSRSFRRTSGRTAEVAFRRSSSSPQAILAGRLTAARIMASAPGVRRAKGDPWTSSCASLIGSSPDRSPDRPPAPWRFGADQLRRHRGEHGGTAVASHFESTMPRSLRILSKVNPIALITFTVGLALQ